MYGSHGSSPIMMICGVWMWMGLADGYRVMSHIGGRAQPGRMQIWGPHKHTTPPPKKKAKGGGCVRVNGLCRAAVRQLPPRQTTRTTKHRAEAVPSKAHRLFVVSPLGVSAPKKRYVAVKVALYEGCGDGSDE